MLRVFETIVIHHPDHEGQPLIIAKDDFDPRKHKIYLYEGIEKEAARKVEEPVKPPSNRAEELREIYRTQGWRAIKAIADQYGIERPENGWDDAIPLILKAEGASDG